MKIFNYAAVGLALASLSVSAVSANAAEMPEREHRAIWVTAYLQGGWPAQAITEKNAQSLKNVLRNQMQRYKDQNINVLYYHVRSNCDAMYNSAYEPWSAKAAGTRGVAPVFDPFEFYVQTAHEFGIEVYAWVNPYRYSNKVSFSGANEYENTHPDWLIQNSQQITLNPGMEEVKQRIVDVISDIVTKYDVDGVVFDDYFYPAGGTTTGTDAPDYALWQQKGNGLSLADWRRANVNEMVQRVNAAIKAIKPYLAFGISPAGIASPQNVTTEYGLPAISGDWQYNQIYSDPLAWLKAGTIDFMSPQVYWPSRFDEVDAWWVNAAQKYNRHYYPSVDITNAGTNKLTAEFIREVDVNRSNARFNESGMVFFQNYDYVNQNENVYGTVKKFGENLVIGAYPTKALTPLRTWSKIETPAMVSNVTISGSTLSWNEIPGMRYTVYAHAKAETTPFGIDMADLNGITYTNSYALPANAADYDWYVATYDRFGNESSPMAVGGTATTASAPVLTYPAKGAEPDILFNFAWTKTQAGRSVVEVARDAAFTDMVGTVSAGGKTTLTMTAFPEFEAGKTYFWRVRLTPVNAPEVVSETRNFVAPQLRIATPGASATGVAIAPVISWTKGGAGTKFLMELSTAETFSSIVYSVETEQNSVTVPAKTLVNGRTYFLRVKATLGEQSMTSQVSSFTVENRTDFTAPEFVDGIAAGVLHADQPIRVADWDGMNTVIIQISTSSTFPPRGGIATFTLSKFATATDQKGSEIKILSKNLAEGTTYYARCKGTYYRDNKSVETAYGPVKTFVYSLEAGVEDVVADAAAAVYVDGTGCLHAPAGSAVTVYNTAGAAVGAFTVGAEAAHALDLNAAGVYLLDVRTADGAVTLKYVK